MNDIISVIYEWIQLMLHVLNLIFKNYVKENVMRW